MLNKLKILFLLLLYIFAIGCGAKKKSVEKVVHKDTISYALPFSSEISLNAICDTLNVPVLVTKSGPVTTQIKYVEGDPVLRVEYDTIMKEKIVYRDRVKEVESVKTKTNWKLAAILVGVILILLFFPSISKGFRRLI